MLKLRWHIIQSEQNTEKLSATATHRKWAVWSSCVLRVSWAPWDQIIANLNFAACDIPKLIFLLCHFCFSQPEEAFVSTSSSGVQMAHQGLFTLSVSMRCLISSGQGGTLSIRVIYEGPYWAYYAWAKTRSFLLSTEGHLCVDYMKENWKLHKYSLCYQISSWLSSIYRNLHSISLNELHLTQQFPPHFPLYDTSKNPSSFIYANNAYLCSFTDHLPSPRIV